MEHKRFVSQKYRGEYLDYLYHKPANATGKLPLVLHLHGAGSRGNDLSLMKDQAVTEELKNGRNIPAVVVVPQCHADSWFDLFHVLTEFSDTFRHAEDVDIDRVYLTGLSMGGYGAWQLLLSHPDWFACAAVCCGGGMYWNAARLKDIPIRAFHGALDTTVFPEESKKMVDAVNLQGGHAELIVYENNGHDSWEPAFRDDRTWEWMFKQKRKNP